jgi:hypothetical protein
MGHPSSSGLGKPILPPSSALAKTSKAISNPNPVRSDIFVENTQQNRFKLHQERHHVERRPVRLDHPAGMNMPPRRGLEIFL